MTCEGSSLKLAGDVHFCFIDGLNLKHWWRGDLERSEDCCKFRWDRKQGSFGLGRSAGRFAYIFLVPKITFPANFTHPLALKSALNSSTLSWLHHARTPPSLMRRQGASCALSQSLIQVRKTQEFGNEGGPQIRKLSSGLSGPQGMRHHFGERGPG